MKVPTDVFLSSISDKKVYYFSSNKINTDVPHYYICLKRSNDDILIMSCCTSQFDTVKKFIESRSLPLETIVWFSHTDTSNPFPKDTYVNCNETKVFTIEEFRSMYNSDSVSFSGEISDNHFHQILTGLHSSPLIEEETKELLPKPISI